VTEAAIPQVGLRLRAWRHSIVAEHARLWSEALHDPNRVHFDADFVAKLGLGDRPINQGPANIAYLYNMLAACFPGRNVVVLDARMTGMVRIGDTIEVTGNVIAVEPSAKGSVVRCQLLLSVCPDASPAVLATADVLFETDHSRQPPNVTGGRVTGAA
jgi:3-hydroxybutyryl-CoA dehydratase